MDGEGEKLEKVDAGSDKKSASSVILDAESGKVDVESEKVVEDAKSKPAITHGF